MIESILYSSIFFKENIHLNKQKQFVQRSNDNVENRLNISFWREAAKIWFAVRIGLTSSLILFSTSMLWVNFILINLGLFERSGWSSFNGNVVHSLLIL